MFQLEISNQSLEHSDRQYMLSKFVRNSLNTELKK